LAVLIGRGLDHKSLLVSLLKYLQYCFSMVCLIFIQFSGRCQSDCEMHH
jgi:hypothetical protein